ncbi:hypothetical protein SLS55_009014 [Diplodia seriata]|uniref:Uncharacterized protein n=1 Tax=Diplodia seriata TaxID=420778 RepID=A0ABR3C7L0_9PEZI
MSLDILPERTKITNIELNTFHLEASFLSALPVCDAISERASTIEILALLKTFISHKHIAWIRGLSREPLEKRMDIIRKRVDGFLLAAPMRLFNEREYYEMSENPRLLSVGFALLREADDPAATPLSDQGPLR